MIKAITCFFINILLIANIALADNKDLGLIVEGMLKLDELSKTSVDSFKSYSYKGIQSDKILQSYLESSLLLSWFIRDKQLFTKMVVEIEKKSPMSPILIYKTSVNLQDTCQACEGSGIGKVTCLVCNGKSTCTNSLCQEGKVKVRDKEFGVILVDCSICLGADICRKCKGEGTVPGNCAPCRTTGMAFSKEKVKMLLKDKLIVLKQLIEDKDKAKFESLQKSKGLVKINGEWITQKRLQELEVERSRLQEAAAKMRLKEEQQGIDKSGESLLKALTQKFKANSAETAAIVENFVKRNPKSKMVQPLAKKLYFLQLLQMAEEYESRGHIGKAVTALSEAVQIEDSPELRIKIKSLDEQTIGL